LRFWPRKPEPAKEEPINWKIAFWEMECGVCRSWYRVELNEVAPMLNSGPSMCPACRYVDSLPYSVQDRYLNDLEHELDS
jgi:hypothetical protein